MRQFMLAQGHTGDCFSLESPRVDGSRFIIPVAYLSENTERIYYNDGRIEYPPPAPKPKSNKHHLRSRP
jgi:hypothetical protein